MTTIRKIVTSKVDGNSADSNDTNEIRPFGEIAVYLNTEPNPDKLTLMMFDGTRTHLKSMVLAPGRLYGSDADSGDGNGRDTIKLIPDASLSDYTGNDQYLIIDPTGGIRIRAGGTQDQSTADLYIGGEQTFVRVSDTTDDVVIRTTTLGNIPIENVNVQTVDELVPPGNVWRIFIIASTYPTLGDTVQIGETVTTAWGTPVTATITDIQQDAGQWQIHVDRNIVTGFDAGPQTVTFNRGSKTWTFDSTGKTVLPSTAIFNSSAGIVLDNLNAGIAGLFNDGDVYITGGNSVRFTGIDTIDGISESVLRFWNAEGRHSSGNDPTELVTLDVGNDATNGDPTEGFLKIITEKEVGGQKEWKFDANGVLHLPTSGDIVDSEGNSVLGGGVADNNIWVQTFESQDGAPTDVVQIVTSVEYDSAGNVIALFLHSNSDVNSNYYSVGKFTTTGVKIWTARFTDDFQTDGWGLAVDNDSDSIYVAGQTTPEIGYSVSTLTKLDSSDGSIVWSKIYDFGFESQSAVVDVASDGSPVMVGYADNESGDSYIVTTKVDSADGTITWSKSLDGQTDDEAYGMAVGPTGEVVTIGYTDTFGVQDAAETLSSEQVSNPLWTVGGSINNNGVTADFTFTDGVPTFTNVVDTAGSWEVGNTIVTVLGSTIGGADGTDDMVVQVATLAANDTDDRMIVVKYDSTGTIAWQKAIQFDAGYDCRGADADIDSDGNIYVTGSYQYDSGEPFGTTSALSILKLDSTGVKQWSRRVTGNCETFGVSVVVGADDKLYLSGVTGFASGDEDVNDAFNWVAAKYGFDGTVEWQRLIDNTTGWTFTGINFFGDGGGSNIAVKNGYVLLGGGFGLLIEDIPRATLVQVTATGDVFSVGDWDFKAASFSGVLSADASDITVVNAGKTDSDNSENVAVTTAELTTEVSNFLVGTLYTAPGGNASLVNGVYSVSLGNTGTLTLPAGGTITEGYVTSNPTIQLTPANPDVASQKLVIKGGGAYTYTDNGISINYYYNTALVGDTLTFYINSPTYADQTLYWWIYPEGAGISDPGSGTVVLTGPAGSFSFVLDSDDNEFTVRVSPVADNYDPANTGVETGLINADAPTFDSPHHLHLTTGNLAETSIFLGTDDHNVRTTVNGGIEITTPNINTTNVWQFGTDGSLQIPGDIRSEGNINIDINLSDSTLRRWSFGEDGSLTLPGDMAIETTYGGGPTLVIDGRANTVELRSDTTILIGYNDSSGNVYIGNPEGTGQVDIVGPKFRVFADAPTTSTGAVGDQAGQVAFSNSHIYYCIADYTDGLSDIWVRSAWDETTW